MVHHMPLAVDATALPRGILKTLEQPARSCQPETPREKPWHRTHGIRGVSPEELLLLTVAVALALAAKREWLIDVSHVRTLI
jgi:hypothetical protein